jgi:oligopeptide/dipeptide ABC transporter ATP-binding protein
MMTEAVLEVRDLATYFYVSGGVVRAVDGVDLDVRKGEILTVVGESGSGKSVTALSIMRLIAEPGRIVRGHARLSNLDLLVLSGRALQQVRGRRLAMIFQNPYTALHPMYRIGDQMQETVRLRRPAEQNPRRVAHELLERIHVTDPNRVLDLYPFEVSAGVCQRVMLAMALAGRPELLIADEPTTNLDALAQAEILGLIREMRDAFGMAVLLITHDFGVVRMMADQVLVMYAGRPVETGPAAAVLGSPQHPYARGLIGSVMDAACRPRRLTQIPGEVPDVMRLPKGCSFRPRCAEAFAACREDPVMANVGPVHASRCWLALPLEERPRV